MLMARPRCYQECDPGLPGRNPPATQRRAKIWTTCAIPRYRWSVKARECGQGWIRPGVIPFIGSRRTGSACSDCLDFRIVGLRGGDRKIGKYLHETGGGLQRGNTYWWHLQRSFSPVSTFIRVMLLPQTQPVSSAWIPGSDTLPSNAAQ